MAKTSVRIDAHLPERRRPQCVTLCHGCCCCCCCCLHTVGGLVGAALGSAAATRHEQRRSRWYDLYEDDDPDLALPPRPAALSAQSIYWLVLLGLIGVGFLIGFVGFAGSGGLGGSDSAVLNFILVGLFVLLMTLPAIQLAAALIALPIAALTDRANAAARVWAIGKITLGLVLGTGIGVGVMVLAFAALGGFR